ncbi:YihY/virulence factor BrkB family protein [Paenibacillus sp. TRM 82003]|uniref:YihY/virulence factor BrkB family protein n=1 Tax=Kineococcus sp. TRM81007 TaxID=2925831 RepID=UPI001F596D08|nr:YhjD/YihY/BrkB family envelope integrity protein [Kineococcus sp. TRM81007]MCI2237704.1 YihY/virulence factor BrkB family protein [Kineococcus sp. TRM81007]MCI3921722.1 YihY/virulence factor BrkB family protein [Paenibacillus sp. TRM 82003]
MPDAPVPEIERRSGAVHRLDVFQRRHPAVGYPLAVVYKFFEDQGAYLAALIAYYGLLALVPLLLLLSTILGYVLSGDPDAQQAVLNSAVAQVPVIGDELGSPERLGGGAVGLVIGVAGALYGATGLGLALQNAVNVAWAVPRNERPNPFLARGRALLLLVTAGMFVVGTAVLSAVISAHVPPGLAEWASHAGAAALAAVGFGVAFRLAAAHRPDVRTVLPGAVAMGVLWQVLQHFGRGIVSSVAERSSVSNQVFTVVLGGIVFLFVAACCVVLCVEADVVRVRRLYPRALLTPLTDAVVLTDADQRAYTRLAQAQRHKGFEQVHVRFGRSPLERDGERRGSQEGQQQVPGEQDRGERDRERGDGVLDARPGAEQP